MILLKTIVREFYRQNIGIFLLIFVVSGVFMSSREHYTFAVLAFHNPILILFFSFSWILLTLKSTLFFRKIIQYKEYQFLFHYRIFPINRKIFDLVAMQAALNGSFIVYSFYMISVGIKISIFSPICLILFINVLLILLPLFYYIKFIEKPVNQTVKAFKIKQFKTPVFYSMFFMVNLFKNHPLLLLLTKLFNLVFITAISLLYVTDDYDQRLFFIAAMIIGISGFQYARQYIIFENSQMLFYRNLPFKLNKRFFNLFYISILILIPEMLFFTRNSYVFLNIFSILQSIIFIVSIQILFFALEYVMIKQKERLNRLIFFGFVILLQLIMYKISILLLSLLIICLSYLIFSRKYYRFEYYDNQNE